MKILFLVKKSSEYGSYTNTSKSGLRNSARLVKEAINKFPDVEAILEFCDDGNDVDNKLNKYQPDLCIIEALWITPIKLSELSHLHPDIEFIIRVHSKTPFLAMEGIAIGWCKAYNQLSKVTVSFNNFQTSQDFKDVGLPNYYLPNIYSQVHEPRISRFRLLRKLRCNEVNKHIYRVGCFGAIRPFKNHLNQAMAAIIFAERKGARLKFYVNAGRLEQGGENVLKNLRALFKCTHHELIELGWYTHDQFLEVINKMDITLQVSFTESFNIVTADSVSQLVPVVVSEEIDWITTGYVDPNNVKAIAERIDHSLKFRDVLTEDNLKNLYDYNHYAVNVWFKFLNH